jgi:three-Cys-motif partner protein
MAKTKDIDPADNLPVSPAGEWAVEKHKQLGQYIYATRHARDKWPSRGYVDLFSGPGRQRVTTTGALIDGSPLVAWNTTTRDTKGVFNHVAVCDLDADYSRAAEKRLRDRGAPVRGFAGTALESAKWARKALDPKGLHLIFVDPYRLRDLPWTVLEQLTDLDHVDLIVHFSTGNLNRYLERYYSEEQSVLDDFAPRWREHVPRGEPVQARARVLEYWASLVVAKGFYVAKRKPLVTNLQNAPLYRLVFFSRDEFPTTMWDALDKGDQSEMQF